MVEADERSSGAEFLVRSHGDFFKETTGNAKDEIEADWRVGGDSSLQGYRAIGTGHQGGVCQEVSLIIIYVVAGGRF